MVNHNRTLPGESFRVLIWVNDYQLSRCTMSVFLHGLFRLPGPLYEVGALPLTKQGKLMSMRPGKIRDCLGRKDHKIMMKLF